MVVEFRDWILRRYAPGDSMLKTDAATREYSTEEMQKICLVGDQLLAFACGKGWKALVKILLPVALFSVHVAKATNCAHAHESDEETKAVDSGHLTGDAQYCVKVHVYVVIFVLQCERLRIREI